MSREAIATLAAIAVERGRPGDSGRLTEMREEAVRQLGTYVPDPEAVRVLKSIAEDSGRLTSMRLLAVEGLGRKQ